MDKSKSLVPIELVGSIAKIEFDFYVIPNEFFKHVTSDCPHCQSAAHPERFQEIDEIGSKVLGDIMMCSDCTQLYIVVDNPILNVDEPVLTKWSVPVRVYKNNQTNKIGYFQGGTFHEISK